MISLKENMLSLLNPALTHARCCLFSVFAWVLLWGNPCWAYTLTCEVQGRFPEMEKIVLPAASVTIDISSIGNHLYIKMEGPKLYNMFVNTLTSTEFEGTDLTSDTSIWVKRRSIQSKEETEIKIKREPVFVKAIKDVRRYGKDLKLVVSGPCQLPSN